MLSVAVEHRREYENSMLLPFPLKEEDSTWALQNYRWLGLNTAFQPYCLAALSLCTLLCPRTGSPCRFPLLRLNMTRGWYLLCVTVQEKTRMLHDDQAPGLLRALQVAAQWGSMLPNEVTQLAEPAGHFLQQLDSSHSAQIFCNKMITTWKPNAFL